MELSATSASLCSEGIYGELMSFQHTGIGGCCAILCAYTKFFWSVPSNHHHRSKAVFKWWWWPRPRPPPPRFVLVCHWESLFPPPRAQVLTKQVILLVPLTLPPFILVQGRGKRRALLPVRIPQTLRTSAITIREEQINFVCVLAFENNQGKSATQQCNGEKKKIHVARETGNG